MAMVLRKFRFNVGGTALTTFEVGERELPPDALVYALSAGYVAEAKALPKAPENKAVLRAPENKAVLRAPQNNGLRTQRLRDRDNF